MYEKWNEIIFVLFQVFVLACVAALMIQLLAIALTRIPY